MPDVQPNNSAQEPTKTQVVCGGGILWRPREGGGWEVALVHRPAYKDWSLPKGKRENGETISATALREVEEETGFSARLSDFAGDYTYTTDGEIKTVFLWHMVALEEVQKPKAGEVDAVIWLRPEDALAKLTYERQEEIFADQMSFGQERMPSPAETVFRVPGGLEI